MDNKKICAVIVTFNRKELLKRCIDAVINQTYKPDELFIIDNASTDGTPDYLFQESAIGSVPSSEETLTDVSTDKMKIRYYRLSSNQGGAGGFHQGLKLAHEAGRFDGFWLMDDDGYPSKDCLKRQIPYLDKYDYVMPLSIDIDNHENLSWATRKKDGVKTIKVDELRTEWGELMPFIFPFNGSLLSRKIVDKVGYINPKLFIWGDDYEHYYRCLKAGFNPVTILDAEFYHPVNKAPTVKAFFGLVDVPFVESPLRFVCLIRNWAYINKTNHRYLSLCKTFAAYTWLFLITRRFDLKNYRLFLASFFDGLREKFDRHKKYLK